MWSDWMRKLRGLGRRWGGLSKNYHLKQQQTIKKNHSASACWQSARATKSQRFSSDEEPLTTEDGDAAAKLSRACSSQVCNRKACNRQACNRQACSRHACSRHACNKHAYRQARNRQARNRQAGSAGGNECTSFRRHSTRTVTSLAVCTTGIATVSLRVCCPWQAQLWDRDIWFQLLDRLNTDSPST